MTELSLHILDIVQNSIAAKASQVEISVTGDRNADWLIIEIIDNGKGMNEKELNLATDPFFTSRTTRRVGMGLSLFKQAAELCEGTLTIESKAGAGTKVKVTMRYSHIDRQPLGDIAGIIALLISSNPDIRFIFKFLNQKESYTMDTFAIKEELEDVSITNPKVRKFIREMIQENINEITNNNN